MIEHDQPRGGGGTIVLQGGGPFTANDVLDARLVGPPGQAGVVMLPTADAFERPELLVAAALAWGERLGTVAEAVMVLSRRDALDPGAADVVRRARVVYLVGDSPLHLLSVMKHTPVWDAVTSVHHGGGTVVGVGLCAAALCDPMVDPRGGAFTLGLGMVTNLALITESETWSADRLHRTLKLAGRVDGCIATMPTGSALVRTTDGWEQVGPVELHGALPR